jgi:hypothetical protein
VEGFGEATPAQALYFLVLVAGFAGHQHQKEKILGGPAAPSPLWVNLPLGGPPRRSCYLLHGACKKQAILGADHDADLFAIIAAFSVYSQRRNST